MMGAGDGFLLGVMMKTVKTGEGWKTPDDLSETKIHLEIKINDAIVYTSRYGHARSSIPNRFEPHFLKYFGPLCTFFFVTCEPSWTESNK